MADIEISSNGKRKCPVSFSNLSQREAERILGFQFIDFYDSQIEIERFITTTAPQELKKTMFDRLIACIVSEGFPVATIHPMNESVVKANVGLILQSMVSYSKLTMNRNDLRLVREKQISSKDQQVRGNMDLVLMQTINLEADRYIFVVEAKRDALESGLTQLLLALKCMWDVNNDNKMVYGGHLDSVPIGPFSYRSH
jgi:hypothetical protein